ncbi:uncharacterized protein LOC132193502 [Neocloeon triangulifer]|uniref:uncharacterized protein LOC132193502 n=1 Tax=Neocloeon triangulifer TaxID=2078957 RepID=UPI00286F4547|nr:uncharacterized protein LOC132193502 [Neocloeon triangulifer]
MRTEGAGQVAVLLAVATLVSLLLVAALSEAKNTNGSRDETSSSEGGALFSVLGRHLSSVLSQSDTADVDMASEKQYLERLQRGNRLSSGRSDNNSSWWLPPSPTRHRHHHGRGRPHRSHHHNSTAAGHEVCYGPNEVLIVIAITCAVNFAFIFGIMTVVHFCNIRNHSQLHSAAALSKLVSAGHADSLTLVADGRCPSKGRRNSCEPCSASASMTMLLLPDVDAEEEAVATPEQWYPGSRNINYQALSQAHSMEDLHILE